MFGIKLIAIDDVSHQPRRSIEE